MYLRRLALSAAAAACAVSGVSSFVLPSSALTPTSGTSQIFAATTSDDELKELFTTTDDIEHAREIFNTFDRDQSGSLSASELGKMLRMLSIDASDDDAKALFKYLDVDDSGAVSFDEEFLPWYAEAADNAKMDTMAVQNVLLERRTVTSFDATPISEAVLRRAIECAIRAPNYSESEPWRFISVGPETARQIAQLRGDELMKNGNYEGAGAKMKRWMGIPGWCVVTTKLNDDPIVEREDFASTASAVQNFMLSMWSEGVGSRLTCGPITQTKEYADLVGVDRAKERVVGCIWYGFARGGLASVKKGGRKKGVDEILSKVP